MCDHKTIKACPFCGYEVQVLTNLGGGNKLRCFNKDCLMHVNAITHKTTKLLFKYWNKRPKKPDYKQNEE